MEYLRGFSPTWQDKPLENWRIHAWFDSKMCKPMYGVQVMEPNTEKYIHLLGDKGQLLLFETKTEAGTYGEEFFASRRRQ